ncbi:kelch-like protein 4 [Gracilinanus agilis]|uniref:kelch-like protein 4 n=1 Tax=Gracilinanus agilis TaxID=191870 RepID=UPI001CFED709|nr:kelch-like protein 4 [Gracilinanus agilis]
MSVSGKKEFDVKQILRLRWRWFSHPSPGAPGPGGCLQQEGYEHRGTSGQSRLKSHSRDRGNGLKKSSANSPGHQNILAPVPGPTPAHQRAIQTWHQQNLIEHFRANEDIPKASPEENLVKEGAEENPPNLQMSTDENAEDSSERAQTGYWEDLNAGRSEEYFHSTNHAEQTIRKMENYLQQKQLCDVFLIAGQHKIPAHRLVLSAASDYFAAMFTNDVLEAKQEEIKMEGIDPDALKALVHYAYTGVLELKEDTIENLLSAACLLQLSQVIEVCCNFLIKQLHPSNCLGIRSFGDAQGCLDLLKVAHNYTMEHFVEVTKNQEFLLLPANEIAKLLSSDDINVPDEEAIFQALMIWVQHDFQNRQEDLGMLLSLIRLPLLPPQLLADLENNSMFMQNLECQKLLMEAMKYHLLPERRSMMQSPRTKPRKSTVGALYAVGGMDATKGTTTIEKYDLRTNSWIQVATMNGRRLQFGVAVIDNKLYIVGGRDGLKTSNTVECFNPVSKIWSIMPPMSTHRHGLGVAMLEGPMYAVGGHDGWSYLNTVERWDPQARQWNYVASMSTPRSTVGVAALNSKYDPKTDAWTTVAPLSVPRDAVGVCPLGDRLYAVGGYDGHSYLNTVESYDAQNNEWTEEVPVNIGRAGACVVVVKLP